MKTPSKSSALGSLGLVRARGPDAVAFLQGQLSNDIAQLSAGRSLLAGYQNPQGRTIAVLRLIEHAPGDILMVLPRELAATVATRLGKFVLRAKVKLTDDSNEWLVHGIGGAAAPADEAGLPLPPAAHEVLRHGEALLVRTGTEPARVLVIEPRATTSLLAGMPDAGEAEWRAGGIAAGEPQVYAGTSEAFVAQMLNLDVLGAIAFDKGCYTGQEVIARAHYRGRVKRRMQRFATTAPAHLAPGDTCELSDGRSVKIVDAIGLADGRCEFLGVTGSAGDEEPPPAQAAAAAASTRIGAVALPLPYELPP